MASEPIETYTLPDRPSKHFVANHALSREALGTWDAAALPAPGGRYRPGSTIWLHQIDAPFTLHIKDGELHGREGDYVFYDPASDTFAVAPKAVGDRYQALSKDPVPDVAGRDV